MKLLMKFNIILCLFVVNSLFSQQTDSSYIQVDYEAAFLIDTANVKDRSKENTTLLISKESSYFKSSYKAIADSLGIVSVKKSVENPINDKIIINGSSIPSAKFKPEVYFSKGKVMVFNQIARDKFIYESPYKILWEIENDTKLIQGYTCRKATGSYGKKIITAWYAEKIPIQEGPYTFKGLPGLILGAHDSKDYFHFTMIGLKYVKKPISKLPFGINTTYEKYYKKRKEMLDDPISSFISTFGKPPPKESEEAIVRNIKRINNFLD